MSRQALVALESVDMPIVVGIRTLFDDSYVMNVVACGSGMVATGRCIGSVALFRLLLPYCQYGVVWAGCLPAQ